MCHRLSEKEIMGPLARPKYFSQFTEDICFSSSLRKVEKSFDFRFYYISICILIINGPIGVNDIDIIRNYFIAIAYVKLFSCPR